MARNDDVPIRVLCSCKRLMVLPDKYSGQHVQCPECGNILRIPAEREDRTLVRWRCECGQRLKARRGMAGRAFTCPKCKTQSLVPVPEVVEDFIGENFSADSENDAVKLAPPGAGVPASTEVSPDAPTGPIAEDEDEDTALDDEGDFEVLRDDPTN